jgi:hypothetical protein
MLCAEMHGQLKNVLPRTVHQYLCEKFGGNAGRAHVPLETDTQVLALLVNLFETIRLSLYTVVGRHRHTFQIAADWKSPPTVNYDAVTAFLLKHHLELAKVFDMSNSPGGPTARSIGYPRFIDLAILVLCGAFYLTQLQQTGSIHAVHPADTIDLYKADAMAS